MTLEHSPVDGTEVAFRIVVYLGLSASMTMVHRLAGAAISSDGMTRLGHFFAESIGDGPGNARMRIQLGHGVTGAFEQPHGLTIQAQNVITVS